LENQFYIRTGFSLPTKSYFDSNWDIGSHFGSITEFGSIYMFNFLKLADGLRLGINVDWAEITYHHVELNYNDPWYGNLSSIFSKGINGAALIDWSNNFFKLSASLLKPLNE